MELGRRRDIHRAVATLCVALLFSVNLAQQQNEIHFQSALFEKGQDYSVTINRDSPTPLRLFVDQIPSGPPLSLQIKVGCPEILGVTVNDQHAKGSFSNYCAWVENQVAQGVPFQSSLSIPLKTNNNNMNNNINNNINPTEFLLTLYPPSGLTATSHTDPFSLPVSLYLQVVAATATPTATPAVAPPNQAPSHQPLNQVPSHQPTVWPITGPPSPPPDYDNQGSVSPIGSDPPFGNVPPIPGPPPVQVPPSPSPPHVWDIRRLRRLRSLSQQTNACHLFDNQYSIDTIRDLMENSQRNAILGHRLPNMPGMDLHYQRVTISGPALTISPDFSLSDTSVVVEGSSSRAVLLDVVIPPLDQLPPKLLTSGLDLQVLFPQLDPESGVRVFAKWNIINPSKLTFFDLTPETPPFSFNKLLLPSSSSSSANVVNHNGSSSELSVPYRFLLFFIQSPSILSTGFQSSMLIQVVNKTPVEPDTIDGDDHTSAPPHDVKSPVTFNFIKRVLVSASVAALSLAVLSLVVGTVIFATDSDSFFWLMRNLPGASTNYEFNRWLAWLEGSAMPIEGLPERAESGIEEENSQGKELQLTLLGAQQQRLSKIDEDEISHDKAIRLKDSTAKKYQLQYKSTASGCSEPDDESGSFTRLHTTEQPQQQQQPSSSSSSKLPFLREQPEIDSLGGLSLLANSKAIHLN